MVFNYIESMTDYYRGFLPPELVLDNNTKAEGKLIRLLSGTIDMEHNFNMVSIQQRINYAVPDKGAKEFKPSYDKNNQ